ncbi:MAG: sn-glycerol-3-phosphate import ATP-binding protein UgpC [Pseudomonadota bacterium]|nr:ATP-binding cassette domain-containing protein [Rubrivivax sp.]NLZ41797.1 ATP-binding cassette domain-containing protein [Comamonadaceae bacterium]
MGRRTMIGATGAAAFGLGTGTALAQSASLLKPGKPYAGTTVNVLTVVAPQFSAHEAPHMTIERNIGYPLKLRGVARDERAVQVRKAAERVDLGPLLGRLPRQLSGGQRQRVALARSIVRRPRVYLMDEPLSNLDAKLRVTARAQIKHLAQELQVTTIYVTHDQVEAMTLAHRVAVMDAGVIRQLGTPEQIYKDPADVFVAGFIGSPAMNLLPVHAGAEGLSAEGGLAIRLPAPRMGDLVLGVRAEDMQMADLGDAHFHVAVYTFELLGDCTMATVLVGQRLLAIKGSKALRLESGQRIGVRLDPVHLYWFDAGSGRRFRAR